MLGQANQSHQLPSSRAFCLARETPHSSGSTLAFEKPRQFQRQRVLAKLISLVQEQFVICKVTWYQPQWPSPYGEGPAADSSSGKKTARGVR
mmetsp:Transcript_9123/g.21294  ORF Transcript_9123/g.21294 Transcript_9123/m.21294 type:complete len:92 (-) Transcript_9123:21-296(-)